MKKKSKPKPSPNTTTPTTPIGIKEQHPEPSLVDKSTWLPGQWQTEPDKLQWIDPDTSLDCLIVRGPHGGLCGYVGVPPTHPHFGHGYGAIDVSVHGGLTYADKCNGHICHLPEPGRPDNIWWFGFDCAHFGDLSPAYEFLARSPGTYRDVGYVQQQCTELAAQLSRMKKKPRRKKP